MHIRWDAWKDDAVLQDREKILDWLSERGVTGPREKREADKRRAAAEEEAMDRWRAAMPECLHSLGDRVFGGDLTPLQTALETALPDVSDTRARHSRMVWSGEGGTWSSFPSYEWMPGKLLLEYATTDVVQVLMSTTVAAVAEGAARHFGGWEFRRHRKEELNLVPTELKKQLLMHALEHSGRENSGDAMSAFGDVLD